MSMHAIVKKRKEPVRGVGVSQKKGKEAVKGVRDREKKENVVVMGAVVGDKNGNALVHEVEWRMGMGIKNSTWSWRCDP